MQAMQTMQTMQTMHTMQTMQIMQVMRMMMEMQERGMSLPLVFGYQSGFYLITFFNIIAVRGASFKSLPAMVLLVSRLM